MHLTGCCRSEEHAGAHLTGAIDRLKRLIESAASLGVASKVIKKIAESDLSKATKPTKTM